MWSYTAIQFMCEFEAITTSAAGTWYVVLNTRQINAILNLFINLSVVSHWSWRVLCTGCAVWALKSAQMIRYKLVI